MSKLIKNFLAVCKKICYAYIIFIVIGIALLYLVLLGRVRKQEFIEYKSKKEIDKERWTNDIYNR